MIAKEEKKKVVHSLSECEPTQHAWRDISFSSLELVYKKQVSYQTVLLDFEKYWTSNRSEGLGR